MKKKILLVNDDGVHAPGILALYHALKDVADVTVVAPLEEKSTTGHSLSLSHPLRLVEIEENRYGVSGFPADCVLMALGTVCETRPDLVISGINRGGNLGQDIYYSGTVAAAREAAFHRIPAVAVSLVMEFSKLTPTFEDYALSARLLRELVLNDIHLYIPPLHLFNINFPLIERERLQGIKVTKVGFRKYSDKIQKMLDPRSKEYFWIVGRYEGFEPIPDSDCLAIDEGLVSLSPVALVPSQAINELDGEFARRIHQINLREL